MADHEAMVFSAREKTLTPKLKGDKFKVIIVGAGLGGLATAMAMAYAGYEVIVYEKIRKFLRLGDSLGVGDNAMKLLARWGAREKLVAIGNTTPVMHVRRWDSGEIIATQRLMDMASLIGHRGDYHQAFFDRVEELGVPIHMGTGVKSYNENDPSVTLENGEVVHADIVIGADGIKSGCRALVLGFEDKPKSSGYACYRAYTDGKVIAKDPLSRRLVDRDSMNIWIGPDQHIVQNACKNGEEFNWIITHKDTEDIAESWSQPGRVADAVALVPDWDPTIVNAMKATKDEHVLDWKIVYREPLPTWVSKTGKICVIGDAAHPHLPTSAQGASQAIEDGACLAICLELAGLGNVRLATLTYERLRYARVLKVQKTGEDTRERWHTALKAMDEGKEVDAQSVCMQNAWIYPHDMEAYTREHFKEVSEQIKKELSENNDVPILPGSLLGPDKYDIPTISEADRLAIAASVDRHVAEMEKVMPIYRGLPGLRKKESIVDNSDKTYVAKVTVKA